MNYVNQVILVNQFDEEGGLANPRSDSEGFSESQGASFSRSKEILRSEKMNKKTFSK